MKSIATTMDRKERDYNEIDKTKLGRDEKEKFKIWQLSNLQTNEDGKKKGIGMGNDQKYWLKPENIAVGIKFKHLRIAYEFVPNQIDYHLKKNNNTNTDYRSFGFRGQKRK